ncbi:MAG: ComF family protein [Lachnospiraceae bacterium]|nr:ComF family protein [Lachnospiraceae bacterium]
MNKVTNGIINLLYPTVCPVCGGVLAYGEKGGCGSCEKTLQWVTEPSCLKCGKMLDNDEDEYCSDCREIPKSYDKGFPVFCYEGPIKDSLYAFKYKNQRHQAAFYVDSIFKRYGEELNSLNLSGIVPVPVHKQKKRTRGYNQAELIATELSKRLNVPVFPNYLERTRKTNPQKELDANERMKNLKNAFKIGENDVKLDKVLIVDDIYTSGATIEACTQALKNKGIRNIYYVSVAIGKGYSVWK